MVLVCSIAAFFEILSLFYRIDDENKALKYAHSFFFFSGAVLASSYISKWFLLLFVFAFLNNYDNLSEEEFTSNRYYQYISIVDKVSCALLFLQAVYMPIHTLYK